MFIGGVMVAEAGEGEFDAIWRVRSFLYGGLGRDRPNSVSL